MLAHDKFKLLITKIFAIQTQITSEYIKGQNLDERNLEFGFDILVCQSLEVLYKHL